MSAVESSPVSEFSIENKENKFKGKLLVAVYREHVGEVVPSRRYLEDPVVEDLDGNFITRVNTGFLVTPCCFYRDGVIYFASDNSDQQPGCVGPVTAELNLSDMTQRRVKSVFKLGEDEKSYPLVSYTPPPRDRIAYQLKVSKVVDASSPEESIIFVFKKPIFSVSETKDFVCIKCLGESTFINKHTFKTTVRGKHWVASLDRSSSICKQRNIFIVEQHSGIDGGGLIELDADGNVIFEKDMNVFGVVLVD